MDFNIMYEDLDKIYFLFFKVGWDVMFGLNVFFCGKDGFWDLSNVKKIMQYVVDYDYWFGWEFGNGKKYFKFF